MQAVRHAVQLTREGLRASFVLVNVQANPSLYELVTFPSDQARRRASGRAGEHLLAPAAALLDVAGLSYLEEVVQGEPERALIDLIERHGCQAVIVGAERIGAVRTMLGGSTSMALLQDSPVPVTVVHPTPADGASGGDGHDDDGDGDGSGDGDGDGGGDGGGGD
jgi:nucleotide-binding universal stress UspA family protein